MKKIFLLVLFTITLVNCSSDDNAEPQPQANENTMVGRWHMVGFEQTVMYEFTADKRYTIYSSDGTFGDISTAIPNPHSWTMENNVLTIDLDFGNISESPVVFKCNGNVVDFGNENGGGNLYREGYNYADCDE